MTALEIARVIDGRVEGSESVSLTGVEVDSRRLETGDLYVALPGERRDGHEFVAAAMDVAGAALVRDDVELVSPPEGRALIRVNDPLAAYHELARVERRNKGWRVAAVTGSVGKTTTKDFLAEILASHRMTGASTGNRNNTLGLPAEVLSQEPDIEVFVAEAGMSTPGELDILGGILRPDVLLYTRIAPAHIESFDGLEGVVRAKAELLPWLDSDGTLVINADDPNQEKFPAMTEASVLLYGSADRDAWIEDFEDRGLLGSRFRLVLPDGSAEIHLSIAGRHQAENLLAAATAASALDVTADQVAAIAPRLQAPEHRGRIFELGDRITLVDDSYNASPVAVARLLDLLSRAPGRRVAVLGEMYELGDQAAAAHQQVGCEAAAACDVLVAVGGEHARRIVDSARRAGLAESTSHLVDDAERAVEFLRGLLSPGDVILVKGSRGVGLDRTVAALTNGEAA